MRGTACFHDHHTNGAVGEETLELGARQAMLFDHSVFGIGDNHLVDVLCQVDGSGSSMGVKIRSAPTNGILWSA